MASTSKLPALIPGVPGVYQEAQPVWALLSACFLIWQVGRNGTCLQLSECFWSGKREQSPDPESLRGVSFRVIWNLPEMKTES